ncbi:MAG TPA: hypothetical protein VFA65_02075 [Bryobacteraceae bacterium]|nr:hypothetical protein [Bryobacteraceae bacterium]
MEKSVVSPATSLRLLRAGDSWIYAVAGSLAAPGAGALELNGEIAVSIVEDRLAGRADWMTILFSQRFEITQRDGSRQPMPAPEWMFSFIQDSTTRDLSIVADNMTKDGTARIAKEPQVFYPGTWSLQTAYNNRLEFNNGDEVKNTLTVFDCEQVDTEAGSFVSWVATISSQSAGTGLIEGKDWWTPDLGAPAQFSTSSTMPEGSRMRFVATLRSSNVR